MPWSTSTTPRFDEWGEGKNVGGGVTAGVRYETRVADFVSMKFWAAVNGFGLELRGVGWVGVVELVDGSVGVIIEAPGSAEVDNFDALGDGGRDPIARLLMRCGEEEYLDAGTGGAFPAEGKDLVDAPVACRGELRVQVFEERDGSGLGFFGTSEKGWSRGGELWMVKENAGEFAAGIAAYADDGGAGRSVRGLRGSLFCRDGCCVSQDNLPVGF